MNKKIIVTTAALMVLTGSFAFAADNYMMHSQGSTGHQHYGNETHSVQQHQMYNQSKSKNNYTNRMNYSKQMDYSDHMNHDFQGDGGRNGGHGGGHGGGHM